MALDAINSLPVDELNKILNQCCGSSRWVSLMIQNKPFQTEDSLFHKAQEVEEFLTSEDWKEAFAAHPRIGRNKDKQPKEWEAKEQESTKLASDRTLSVLEEYNDIYFSKFGYIFIVCATGKTADEMLEILKNRLDNEEERELQIAAEEQRKITKLRLQKFLNSYK